MLVYVYYCLVLSLLMSSDSVVMQTSFKCCAYICVCACGLSCVATLQLKIGGGRDCDLHMCMIYMRQ